MIIINEANRERIEAAIRDAEGRATVRTVEYRDIVQACERVEKTLGIAKKDMEGVAFDVDPNAQDFPHAYKYIPYGTRFVIVRQGGRWRVDNIRRDRTRGYGKTFQCVGMPEATAEAIIRTRMLF